MVGSGTGTREQILDAALGCLGRFGFRRTSIEAIAEAARTSRPTVYQYFSGKEDIFRAVAGRMLDAALAAAELAAAGSAPLTDRLHGVLDAKFSMVVGHTGADVRAEVLAEAASIAGDLLTAFHQRLAAVLTGVLDGASDQLDLGRFGLSAADVAALLLDAVTGIEHGAAPPEQLHRRLRQLVELTVRGLRREEG